MKNILVVEDEKRINDAIASYFKRDGYHVTQAYDGKEAIDVFEDGHFDIVILDIMMPKLDGWSVCRRIRMASDVLIVMLTALEDDSDILMSFELGADEYITKPFSPKVLLARVNALVSRFSKVNEADSQVFGNLRFDKKAYKFFIDDLEIELTPIENLLIRCFFNNHAITLTRDQILDLVWGKDYFGDCRVVDTHVKNLRKKLGQYSDYVQTIKQVGYRFEVKS